MWLPRRLDLGRNEGPLKLEDQKKTTFLRPLSRLSGFYIGNALVSNPATTEPGLALALKTVPLSVVLA